ncbi:MAG: ankyrin repeat domain-containing protein, partial [Alphaproteobacteria bacterium]|nr:ankyrin repeat domain-containing protein [Alphaproteobacteria bacterium]
MIRDNKSLTERLMDFFGFKSSENQGDTASSSSSSTSSSSISDFEIVDTVKNLTWRDIFRPGEVFTLVFHPSSVEREESKKSGGLLDVFHKYSAGTVLNDSENAESAQARNEPFSWKGLFNDWLYGPEVAGQNNNLGSQATQPTQAPSSAQPTQAPAQGEIALQQSANPKDQALIQAIENKDEKQVTALLNEGANPNAVNQYGESALQLAVENGSIEMVDALIEHQADVNKVSATPEARAPLLVAAERGDEAMVHRLLEAGADATKKDEQGKTAMHYATSRAMMGDLLEHGGDLMAEDLNGRAPLHDMVARGEYEVIDEALFYGADPSKADV